MTPGETTAAAGTDELLADDDTVGGLVDSLPRSADAIATSPIVVYEMDRAAFQRVLTDHPALAAKLMTNMARAIAARLRATSDHLRAVS